MRIARRAMARATGTGWSLRRLRERVPSFIGNLLWGTGLFSQIAWPLYVALRATQGLGSGCQRAGNLVFCT